MQLRTLFETIRNSDRYFELNKNTICGADSWSIYQYIIWYTKFKARLNTIENHMGATEAAP